MNKKALSCILIFVLTTWALVKFVYSKEKDFSKIFTIILQFHIDIEIIKNYFLVWKLFRLLYK